MASCFFATIAIGMTMFFNLSDWMKAAVLVLLVFQFAMLWSRISFLEKTVNLVFDFLEKKGYLKDEE